MQSSSSSDLSTLEVVLQTDAVIASLSSLLAQCDKLKLSEASKALLVSGNKMICGAFVVPPHRVVSQRVVVLARVPACCHVLTHTKP